MGRATTSRGISGNRRGPILDLRSRCEVQHRAASVSQLFWDLCHPYQLLQPWQNGIAERWVRSFRNDLLDHVIVVNEGHLNRLAQDYLRYYHADRTHDGLDKGTPEGRPKSIRNPGQRLSSLPRLGGLHHRYSWEEAA